MKSDPKLKWWYGYFNRAYFGGELPTDTIVHWDSRLKGTRYDGHLSYFGDVDDKSGDDDIAVIAVNPELSTRRKVAHMTLLHEMVHLHIDEKDLDDNSSHGRLFCREMLELAKKGAFDRLW